VFEIISRTLAAFSGMFMTMFVMVYIGKAPTLDVAFSWLEEVCIYPFQRASVRSFPQAGLRLPVHLCRNKVLFSAGGSTAW
jgi:hypothetical protein